MSSDLGDSSFLGIRGAGILSFFEKLALEAPRVCEQYFNLNMWSKWELSWTRDKHLKERIAVDGVGGGGKEALLCDPGSAKHPD